MARRADTLAIMACRSITNLNKSKLYPINIMSTYATYSPEDNKLRLYVGRVPRAEYEALRADGWTSTPKQGDFLTMAGLGSFDAIAMNPPFHMRADIRHILHAASMLRPGATMAALCLAGPHREKELRPLADTWEEIPAGAFRREGTNVPTILLTIKKD